MTAAEPAVALTHPETEPVGILDYDDRQMPNDDSEHFFGPATPEQAVDNLREAERQFAAGQWMSGEAFFQKTREMIGHYAS